MTLMGKDTVALVQNMIRRISFKVFESLLMDWQLLFHLLRRRLHLWEFSRTFSSGTISLLLIQGLLQTQTGSTQLEEAVVCFNWRGGQKIQYELIKIFIRMFWRSNFRDHTTKIYSNINFHCLGKHKVKSS